MTTSLAAVALIFLVIAIAVGFIKNMNTGIMSMGLALIAAIICKIPEKQLISGFPTSTFVLLFGVMFYFGIVQSNKTLHVLAQKVMALTGKHIRILPFVVLYLAAFISGVGAGPIPGITIMTLASVSLGEEMGVPSFLFVIMAAIGGVIGSCSPFSLVGLISMSIMEPMGYVGTEWPFFINTLIGHSICAVFMFFLLKGYQLKPKRIIKLSEVPKFTKEQSITMTSIVVFIFLVAVVKLHTGLTALVMGIILVFIGIADEKTVIKNIPWGTLMMITGVNVLMNIVVLTGGINIMTTALTTIMSPITAKPLIALTSGVMSIFSTTSSVVVPTMLPTIPAVVAQFPTATPVELVSSIVNGSYAASISPLSAGGGTALATYISIAKTGDSEQNVLFKKLLVLSVVNLLVMAIVSVLPIYLK